ncbi:MAG: hypothetical protein VX730_06880 [Pseudomonadota bacterium]|nr:hypothetical protein [Pseudomonadota bacterium]
MAARNYIVAPILSATLANAMRDSQVAAHQIISEDEAVELLLKANLQDKTALVIGCDPRSNVPYADEQDECYNLMFYTDSPDTMYRLIRRGAGRLAPCDLWLYENLGHTASMTDGEAYANSDSLQPSSSVDVVDLLRHGLSGYLTHGSVPHIVNMRAQDCHGKLSEAFLESLDVAEGHLTTVLNATKPTLKS